MEKVDEKIRCKNCGSTQIYLLRKTNQRFCRRCGHIQDLKIKEGGKE
jgi:ribosomal protein S27E